MKKEKTAKISIKNYDQKEIQKYINFIFDNDLQDKLITFETGYQNGEFFIDIEGTVEDIDHIQRLSIKQVRGKYIRVNK